VRHRTLLYAEPSGVSRTRRDGTGRVPRLRIAPAPRASGSEVEYEVASGPRTAD
jgi:hypothetical protein